MRPTFTVNRYGTGSSGTFGKAKLVETTGEVVWDAYTLEEQWKDNKPSVSCIPAGRYIAKWQETPKHPNGIYVLQDVPGRTMIEIHSGNVENDILGCLLVGGTVGSQWVDDDEETPEVGDAALKGAVKGSLKALHALHDKARRRELLVVITWSPELEGIEEGREV